MNCGLTRQGVFNRGQRMAPQQQPGNPLRCPRRTRTYPTAHVGFTLVELLVVGAVLAILGGLLLPAIARAKRQAHLARCSANLRQLGIATQLYWDENRGECFRYIHGQTNYGMIYWFGWLGPGAEGQRDFDITLGALYPYIQGRGLELCPALDYSMSKFKLKARGAAYGYGYNLCLSTAPKQPPFKAAQIRTPAQTALFTDTAQVNTFQAPASPENPMLEEFYYFSTNKIEATVHFRHNARANTVFCDGHLGRQPPEPGSLDTRMPTAMVGRLPPEHVCP